VEIFAFCFEKCYTNYTSKKQGDGAVQILIDDMRYHTNRLTPKEKGWAWQTYCRVGARYENFFKFIEKTLAPLELSKSQSKAFLTDVTVAFAHYAKIAFAIKTEKELDALLKKFFFVLLPYIVENTLTVRASHPVQYEPIAVVNIYVTNTLQKALEGAPSVGGEDKFTFYYIFEFMAWLRSIRGLIFLLTIGDDVHGMALLRGVIEIASKILFIDKYREEYVLFKDFNAYLQEWKITQKPLPLEMVEYLQGEKDYAQNKENFLAYGWAKNQKGKRILTMREFFYEGLGKNKDIEKLFQITSEFVHEDYVGVGYDYVSIRKYLLDLCFYFYRTFLGEDMPIGNLIPKATWRKIRHALQVVLPYYRGEFPIE
jgi:hypothetical protein